MEAGLLCMSKEIADKVVFAAHYGKAQMKVRRFACPSTFSIPLFCFNFLRFLCLFVSILPRALPRLDAPACLC